MILLGILATSDILPLEDDEKKQIITWITDLQQRKKSPPPPFAGPLFPLTVHAEDMIYHAELYQDQLKDKLLSPVHIILALLSTQNYVDARLGKAGITFDSFVVHLQQQHQLFNVTAINRMLLPFRSRPYRNIHLQSYGRRKKRYLAHRHAAQAQSFFRYYDIENCRRSCELALQLQPNFVRALIFLAACAGHEKDYNKAVHYCLLALEKEPQNADIMGRTGYYYIQLENNTAAEAWLKKALALAPDSAWILNNLGYLYTETQRHEEAIPYLDQAISANPDYFFSYNNKGFALMELGDLSQARELMMHALSLNKGNAYNYYNLARLHLKENDTAGAISLLQKARLYNFAGLYGPEVDVLLSKLGDQESSWPNLPSA